MKKVQKYMRHDMDFKQLESFITVVDEGSFSAAAERLKLSQSMVTIHIRNLETELGTRLLNRTTRSMELSADGKTFYMYARQMLKLNRDSMFALARADGGEESINIVATPYTSRYYLSGRIADFLKRCPDARFQITVCYNSEIHSKLESGGFEFAFCNMKIQNPEYSVVTYDQSSLVAVTPNEERFRALQGKPFPAEMFGSEPLITRSSNSSLQQEFLNWVREKLPQAKLNIVTAIDDTETIKKVVAAGCGISVLSEVAVREYVRDGRLLAFPLEEIVPHYLYFVSKKKYLTETQARFRDFITEGALAPVSEN